MSRNFYLQSTDTSATSLSENQPHNTSIQKSSSSCRDDDNNSSNNNNRNNYEDDYDYDDDSDDNPLPFPAPPERSDFLAPSFEPSNYLSNLASSRYQTLEDLRTELRSRSQLLSQELLDLVNAHHDDFTGLGKSLEGGDEKVEEVRVGVLGFRREVEDMRRKVAEREAEVERLIEGRRRLRREIELGRLLLEFEERITVLEKRLRIGVVEEGNDTGGHETLSVSSEDEDDEDDDFGGDANDSEPAAISLSRVSRHVQDLKSIEHMAARIGTDHSFIQAQQERTARLRDTLLLDLGVLAKQLKQPKGYNMDQQLKILNLYGEIGASGKAIEAFRNSN